MLYSFKKTKEFISKEFFNPEHDTKIYVLAIVIGIGLAILTMVFIRNVLSGETMYWVQTDWSGGEAESPITGTVNTYESKYNVDETVEGQVTLSIKEGWVDTDFSYRRKINLNNTVVNLGVTSEELVDFPVLIKLDNEEEIDYSKTKDSGEDIRFYDSDEVTELAYEIEEWNEEGSSYIWVKVPQIDIESDEDFIYMYYGNEDASDGQNVEEVWNNNQAMIYHFNEPEGTSGSESVIDSTDNTAGTPDQIIFGQPGQISSSADFSSSTGISLGTVGPTLLTAETTISFWIYSYSYTSPSRQNPFGQAYGGWGTMTVETNGRISWFFGSNGSNSSPYGAHQSGNMVTSQTNQWIYVTSVRDPSTYTYKWYKNGVYLGGSSYNSSYPTIIDRTFSIGDDYVNHINGRMDEFRIENAVRSAAWIAASYKSQTDSFCTFASEESRYEAGGFIVSNVIDMTYPCDWDELTYNYSGGGTVSVKVRSDSVSNMENAPDFSECVAILSSSDLSANDCVNDTNRYIQYQFILETTSETPVFEDISIGSDASDQVPPTLNATDVILENAINGDWTNLEPEISWIEGEDNAEGNGILGYCISLDEADPGNSNLLNPAQSGGKFNGLDDGVSVDYCDFIASGVGIDLSSIEDLELITGKQYYFSIKAVDLAGNIWTGAAEDYQDLVSFYYDDTPAINSSYISVPGNFVSSKAVTVTWPTSGPDSPTDPDSGFAGLQYRIGEEGVWYGDLHTGTEGLNDLLVNDGYYTMDEVYDYDVLQEGSNFIYFRALDNVGNVTTSYTTGVIKINTLAPSGVQNVQVDPASNTINSYAFSWSSPETYIGQETQITYCYTINTLPSVNTCTYTSAGTTSLQADAFATQPGQNTIYIVARDEAGNINYDTYVSKIFEYNGSSPGISRNLDIADISIKISQNWRLALTWDEPEDVGAGVGSYKVYRGTTETTCTANFSEFDLVGTTTATSYVDMDLDQSTYYYCVKACDSANNCGAISGTVSELPTGKFTEPANLVNGPDISLITTSRAVISWVTDRGCDTKIAYGNSSGLYLEDEIYRSNEEVYHSITLNNLKPGTIYYFKAKWTDEDGNTGISEEKTFQTDPPPVISDIKVTGIGISFANLKFTSENSSRVKIYYGQNEYFGGFEEFATSLQESSYTIQLSNLNDDITYFYKINPVDIEGEEYEGTILSFKTLPRPRVSDIQIEEVKGTAQPSVKINWQSNTDVSSIIGYYPEGKPELELEKIDLEMVNGEHEVEIGGLSAKTKYILVVKGRDSQGNEAVSDEQRFTTATDSRPPSIFNVKVEGTITKAEGVDNDAKANLIVTWDTDELATAQVEYAEGSGGSYIHSTQVDENLTQNHVVVVSELNPSKVYHLRVVSADATGNIEKGEDLLAITPKATESVYELLLSTLGDIFNFIK